MMFLRSFLCYKIFNQILLRYKDNKIDEKLSLKIRVITKVVKTGNYSYNVRCKKILVKVRGMPWLKTDTTHYHAQLGFPDNGRSCRAFDREILHFINKIWFKDTSKLELIREKGNTTFLLKRISDLLSQSVREADTTIILK